MPLSFFLFGVPITGHEGPLRDMDAKVHIYTAMAVGRGRVASPTFGRLYPQGKLHSTQFIGG